MDNKTFYVKYIYRKYKNLPIPYGCKGKVLLSINHPLTSKMLVDFGKYGRAIVPLSAIEEIS